LYDVCPRCDHFYDGEGVLGWLKWCVGCATFLREGINRTAALIVARNFDWQIPDAGLQMGSCSKPPSRSNTARKHIHHLCSDETEEASENDTTTDEDLDFELDSTDHQVLWSQILHGYEPGSSPLNSPGIASTDAGRQQTTKTDVAKLFHRVVLHFDNGLERAQRFDSLFSL
jgi:hypothetical protein